MWVQRLSKAIGAAPTAQAFPLADLWRGWHADPAVLFGIVLLAAGYLVGTFRLWQRPYGRRTLPLWRVGMLLASLLAVAVALLSPLDTLSSDLLSAHMIQHLLLLIVAPLCLVLSRPLLTLRWSLPPRWRRRTLVRWQARPLFTWLRRTFESPLLALGVYTAVLWLWHMPVFYEAALHNEAIHIVEHAAFFGAALLLWWVTLFPAGGRQRYGISIALVFLTALQGSILGALLTFSNVLWYPANSPAAAYWGMTPLDDQHLAGMLMWVPPGIFYIGVIAALFALWLAALERGQRRRERAQCAVAATSKIARSSGWRLDDAR